MKKKKNCSFFIRYFVILFFAPFLVVRNLMASAHNHFASFHWLQSDFANHAQVMKKRIVTNVRLSFEIK